MRLMIDFLYYRFFYRPFMKLAHKYEWHHMRTSYVQDPSNNTLVTMVKCDWCGLSVTTDKQNTSGNSGVSISMGVKKLNKLLQQENSL